MKTATLEEQKKALEKSMSDAAKAMMADPKNQELMTAFNKAVNSYNALDDKPAVL